jgi:hypothetical protein
LQLPQFRISKATSMDNVHKPGKNTSVVVSKLRLFDQ